MKNCFKLLLVYCCIVAFFIACSQKKNDQSQQKSSELTLQSDTLKKKHDKKISKQNLVVKEWNTNVVTNTNFLDHVTYYNPEGLKIEEQEYNLDGLKWRERYEYDSNGNKIRELLYNGLNQLISIKKFEYNEFGKKKITYTYNASGKLVAIKNYEYVTQ